MKKYIPVLLSGNFTTYPQIGPSHYYEKRTREDGLINWEQDVFEIYNLVRAITKPYPGAYSEVNGEKMTIWKAQPLDTRTDTIQMKPGEIIWVAEDLKKFVVKCLGGSLLVNEFECCTAIHAGDIIK